MTRDPLLPVRLVDGVWITKEPQTAEAKHRQEHLVAELMSAEAVELGRSLNRNLYPPPDDLPPSTGARPLPCDPYPPPPWAKVVSITTDQITDATARQPGIMTPTVWMPWGYGGGDRDLRQWATPGTTKVCFALVALDGSGVHGLGADLASAQAHAMTTRDDGDPAWLDTLRAVTLSGEPAAVQALVDSLSSLPAGGDVWEGT